MKKIVSMAIATAMICCTITGCGSAAEEYTQAEKDAAVSWFTETSVLVKGAGDHIYKIVRDNNGYLYYMNEDGDLIEVKDSWMLHSRDITIFGSAAQ